MAISSASVGLGSDLGGVATISRRRDPADVPGELGMKSVGSLLGGSGTGITKVNKYCIYLKIEVNFVWIDWEIKQHGSRVNYVNTCRLFPNQYKLSVLLTIYLC